MLVHKSFSSDSQEWDGQKDWFPFILGRLSLSQPPCLLSHYVSFRPILKSVFIFHLLTSPKFVPVYIPIST